jgi:hypothetical protein
MLDGTAISAANRMGQGDCSLNPAAAIIVTATT